ARSSAPASTAPSAGSSARSSSTSSRRSRTGAGRSSPRSSPPPPDRRRLGYVARRMASVFNHVGLCVTDLARSRRFYEELLCFGFQRELRPPDDPSARLLRLPAPLGMTAVYLERDGFVLELLHFAGVGATAL